MAITHAHSKKRPVHICECGDHAWLALTRGFVALVDVEDAPRVGAHRWTALRGYDGRPIPVRRENAGPYVYLHREIIDAPPGLMVDHINHDTADGRKRNLRLCVNAQNTKNQSAQKGRSSRFKGVYRDVRRGKWQAYINADGKRYRLGRFATEEDAALAYDAKAFELHGVFAATNASLGLFVPQVP